jgi:dipeptide/tripeptide permease
MSAETPVDRSADRPAQRQVDPRGQRFAAAVTTLVLAVVLLTQSVWLLGLQAVVFGVGALAGVRRSPYALAFAKAVRPRIGPPAHTEDPRPPRFAQAVGLAFAVVGLAGFLLGVPMLGLVATGLALAAAFLNAAIGLCLGCEMYLLIRRTFPTKNNDRASTPTEVSA